MTAQRPVVAKMIDFSAELNGNQMSAVVSPPERPALVLAGAGSGKTRTLTYRVAWLLSECAISPSEILLLTFTNKAAVEMLDRVYSLTECEPRRFWGGTFHSIGNRFLRIEGRSIGISSDFTIMDSEDSVSALKNAAEKACPKFFSNKENPRPALLMDIISYARNTCLSIPRAMAERFSWIETPAERIADIAQAYTLAKRNGNLCDFDDLLELWLSLLESNPDILEKYRERFANVLVDEYQDTNALQCRILDLLAGGGHITAVGDDAQCIYSWRGARLDNILRFRERYPAAYIYKIEQNYRSTAQILAFANCILDSMPVDEAYKKTLLPARIGGALPMVLRALDSSSQGRMVASMILEIIDAGRYAAGDIAVLYRSHFQSMDLQLCLQEKHIDYVITSGVKFFEQSHIKDVIAQLRWVANPSDFVSFWRFVKFLPKIGEKTALKIYSAAREISEKTGESLPSVLCQSKIHSKVPQAAREIFADMASSLAEIEKMLLCEKLQNSKELDAGDAWAEPAPSQADFFDRFADDSSALSESAELSCFDNALERAHTPADIVRYACSGWYVNAMKTMYEDWNDRVDDFDALVEYAAKYANFWDFLSNVSLEMSESEGSKNPGLSGERRSDRVRLMTVHQAKGLEFPVVFVIGAAEGLFPTQRSIDEGDVEEERRLFYVAATRARDHLIITYPRAGMVNGVFEERVQSRFLESVPRQLYSIGF